MNDDIRMPKRADSDLAELTADDAEPSFAPPDMIAEQEEIIDMTSKPDNANNSVAPSAKQKKGNELKTKLFAPVTALQAWLEKRSKKQKIIITSVAFLLLIAIGVGAFFVFNKPKPSPKPAPTVLKVEKKVEPPKPTTEASHLTGVQVQPEFNLLPVTGIMIENSPDARPQSGLKDAGVVFEAVAEGGITRFLTLFQEAQPDYVGPVRSVRPYYLEWLEGFDAAIAHVGGSGEGLAKLNADGVKDLDQFYNGGPYQRISERYAPHNVYTSLGGLIELEKSKGWTSSKFTGFTRKVEKAPPAPTVTSIDFAISGPLYNAHYDYVPATNSYNRSEGGKPHTDEKSAQQLSPKVVIAIVLPQGIDPDGIHTTYNTLGTGKAYIFQDGGVTEGTWAKASDKEQFKFLDGKGAPIGLNPGQTWISAVGDASDVTHNP